MDQRVETCEKPCMLRWCTYIPTPGNYRDSPLFTLENKSWYFRFTGWAFKEFASLSLIKEHEYEAPTKFFVSVHVKDKTSNFLFLNRQGITDCATTIWVCTRAFFQEEYPEVDLQSNTLTFFFTFDSATRNFQDIKREHRSVQTPRYLDDRPCLESLSSDLCKLVDEGWNPDVELKCGDRTLPAHRLILGARSEVFRAMLQSDMLESREGSIEIADMKPGVFELFFRYIYTGTIVELTVDDASPLYEAGDKYNVEGLMKRCGDFLAENLTPDNACEILAMAYAHDDKDLKDKALSYVLDENIPDRDKEWLKFCEEHPIVAIEVLNRAYKESK